MFPRIYQDIVCPLDGYAGYSFRVLANPTGAEKDDWAYGNLGDANCPDCAILRSTGTPEIEWRCPNCTTARERWSRVFVAVYGTSRAEGFDFSTPSASLMTLEQPDIPDELLGWLYMLPPTLWSTRNEAVKKKLLSSLASGDSTTS